MNERPEKRVTLIAGATASGKSALAVRLAEARGGVVANADSMQVYRELSIITARPSAEDEARVPHLLYGHRPAAEPYSVAEWLREIAPLIAEARGGGAPVMIVGGTGLYFRAALEGLSPVPEIPEDIRSYWRAEALAKGAAALHAILAARDPVMAARLRPSDPQRTARALEVLDATGVSLAEWQCGAGERLLAAEEVETLYVSLPREQLYARCDARFDIMMRMGALDEVARLRDMGLAPSLPAMRALGVRPLLAHLAGEIDIETALTLAKTETRQYAKRQLTWGRRNMIAWKHVSAQ